VNESLLYDTGLLPEEIALLWKAISSAQAAKHFGALSQWEPIGIDADTRVAQTILEADNALGGLVYGYDAQFVLGTSPISSYKNPFLQELALVTTPAETARQGFNILLNLAPRFFLRIRGTEFSLADEYTLVASATRVTSALGVVGPGDKPVTEIPQLTCKQPFVIDRFPWNYIAFQHFVEHFARIARLEPRLARVLAYGEVVMLLRRAIADRADFANSEHLQKLYAAREHVSTRLDYTLRSGEFARTSKQAADKLAATGFTSFDRLMAGLVGLNYATFAGDKVSFSACKDKVERCLQLDFQKPPAPFNTSRANQELYQLLPAVKKHIRNTCHDILIDNCLQAAFRGNVTAEQQTKYLVDASELCGDPTDMDRLPLSTQNRFVEICSYLVRDADPVKRLQHSRFKNPDSLEPFHILNRVNARRRSRHETRQTTDQLLTTINRQIARLNLAKTRWQSVEFWQAIMNRLTIHHAVWLLSKISSPISAEEYRTTFAQHLESGETEILQALLKLIVSRLKLARAREFEKSLLHRDNLFVDSHQILGDFVCLENKLFDEARAEIEIFPAPASSFGKFVKQLLPEQLSLSAAERWWLKVLEILSPMSKLVCSRHGLLLAYELRTRRLTVPQLYERMRQHRTENPQAGLFLFDLEAAKKPPHSANISRTFDPQKLFGQPNRSPYLFHPPTNPWNKFLK
jgi:hypothetical protein